jgi:hypothetical protein
MLLRGGVLVSVFGAMIATVPVARGGEPGLSLEQLARMNWPELEQLYRSAEPGTIPEGYARGRAIYSPDDLLYGPRSKMTRWVWHGKHFQSDGTLVNQWLGVRTIRARVAYDTSWFDGRPSIVMDYCGMSKVWADVRDEMREVAPGLYLGVMYQRRCPEPRMKMFFALDTKCNGGCKIHALTTPR